MEATAAVAMDEKLNKHAAEIYRQSFGGEPCEPGGEPCEPGEDPCWSIFCPACEDDVREWRNECLE
jgi:hypothetical protein